MRYAVSQYVRATVLAWPALRVEILLRQCLPEADFPQGSVIAEQFGRSPGLPISNLKLQANIFASSLSGPT
jgi:hypothetical protein